MWGINPQLEGRRFGFVFNGLSGVSWERGLTGQESLGGGLGSLLSQVFRPPRRTKPPSKVGMKVRGLPLKSRRRFKD
jgi:hypothetical protein